MNAPSPNGNATTLANLRQQPLPQMQAAVAMNMDTVAGFENLQRAAKLFSRSNIVPKPYQGEEGLPNCFIALDMALRIGANPLLVMQNLYVVHGNPAWSAQFLIATFNKSGRFSALRYEMQGEAGKDNWGCRAVAIEKDTKEKLTGPLVTIALAKKEGWYGKSGSKWQTMPEQMLRYRAASWFIRSYAPEIAMGLRTEDEIRDAPMTVDLINGSQMTIEELAKADPGKEVPKSETKKAKGKSEPQESANEAKPEANAIVRYDCPKEGADGKTRTVTKEDCDKCKNKNGCPIHKTAAQVAGDNEDVHRCVKRNQWVPDAECEVCPDQKGCQDYWPQTEAKTPEPERIENW